ncbi:conserved hypothetical protein [Gloeothece citriformis PCC 7424]|uniref:Uncharacterized protein n=1 Tax=Gloeothece citriformis (strain PCC 7424) TaxID=65393 RepID=B7KHM4_GLOC7|nr:hypothetical protein [Gloeothece citriformis]ACK70719.1 conserved hypothetical protein [Gloeothece citriformis PCC 7424]
MNHPYSFSDCTSTQLEKIALTRFRALVNCLPKDCRIFREPWNCSTILCLDFASCPHKLDNIKLQDDQLLSACRELGLANAVIFRVGNKFRGMSGVTP